MWSGGPQLPSRSGEWNSTPSRARGCTPAHIVDATYEPRLQIQARELLPRVSWSSRGVRSARMPPEILRELPGFPETVGRLRRPQRARRREVSAKLMLAPSCRAAARRTRRRRLGSRGRRRSISRARLEAPPGPVGTDRPPPRTGLPGRRSWGRRRLSSACQRASSSRASSERLERAWSSEGLKSRSCGRRLWRRRLRVKAGSAFEASLRQGWLRERR